MSILNKYGGRSFNDLSQYPVFPWIISDYKSDSISLDNPKIYRQLKYNMGAISKHKRNEIKKKYNSLLQEKAPMFFPYQIGSHYMAKRMVLGYLLRLEPYTTLLMEFENGFEVSSRIFNNIEYQWDFINDNSSDNKELTPEFFYLPEIFGNYNKYNFGTKILIKTYNEIKSNELVRVDQVLLPNWAQNNHHFVQLNYLALESDIVSSSLHQWIDLMFGVKLVFVFFRQQNDVIIIYLHAVLMQCMRLSTVWCH